MRVESGEFVVLEKWTEKPKENWRRMLGRRVLIGQQCSGAFYIKIQNLTRCRYNWQKPEEISESVTRTTPIKFKPDEVDMLIDALITIKEMMKKNQALSTIITKK